MFTCARCGAPVFEDLRGSDDEPILCDVCLEADPQCVLCGCTDAQACPGGCIWATPDLCSRCVG